MNKICRTCLRTTEKLLPMLEDPQLPHKIEIISSVEILESDYLPMNICPECILNINLSYNFRKLIINSEFELRKRYRNFNNKNFNLNEELHTLNSVETINNEGSLTSNEENVTVEELKNEFGEIHTEVIIENTDSDDKTVTNSEEKDTQDSLDSFQDSQEVNTESINKVYCLSSVRNKIYKCRSCTFVHSDYNIFKKHKRMHWTSIGICSICGKSIRTDNLKKHMSIHTESPIACKTCGKICKNTESLRGHALIHRGIQLKCKLCGKVYKYRAGYALHLRRHAKDNVKTVKCPLCSKFFHEKNDLKKHMRSHTGERPYPCEFCKKGFSSSYALKTHKRQHTNERPYVCSLCPMAFPQKVSLRTHLKSKHSTDTSETAAVTE